MKYLFGIAFLFLLSTGCADRSLVQPKDYEASLVPDHIEKAVQQYNQEILFWEQRLQQDTQSFVSLQELGHNYLSLFQLKGKINNLKTGDSLLKVAAAKLNYVDPDMLHALSQVAITQHQFRQAALYNQAAAQQNGSPYVHALLSFDVEMELGRYHTAKGFLNVLKEREAFDILIRKAKYQDHIGDLEGAIVLMETAFEKVVQTNKKNLYCWALANLGDMYGHAGRIEEAYAAYLKVLEKDASYLYALKGIAWIAYAHDENITASKRILQFIKSHTHAPDVYLLLAEIADFENRQQEKKEYIQKFLQIAADPAYNDMYNKALIQIYTEEKIDLDKALQLATKEVEQRPTPETYSWLAWVHLKKGNLAQAIELFDVNVKGRSFEPEVQLKGAYIMEAAGRAAEARRYFEACAESRFEIGPVQYKIVAAKLK